MCGAKTGGGEGAPTTCYTISIDYVMLRIKGTDGDAGTTQPWRFFSLEGRGEIGWESAGIATERSDGGNDCSLPYLTYLL